MINNSQSNLSFLEFSVLFIIKNLPGPTYNELFKKSCTYGLKNTELNAGLVGLMKKQLIIPWSIYYVYSTFPFTGFHITEKGKSVFSFNETKLENLYYEFDTLIIEDLLKNSIKKPKKNTRQKIEDIYYLKFQKKPIVRNVKKNSNQFNDPTFAAERYSKIAWHKLKSKKYSEAASFYGSSAICYSHMKNTSKAKKYYIKAGKCFKEIRDIYSSLDCFYGAIIFSKQINEKQNLINQLPLPIEIISKINPESFEDDYSKVSEELDGFLRILMKIEPARTGGFLATLTNRFAEYFEMAINEIDGEKLKMSSRIFYHMIEAFQNIVPNSNLPEFEDYEITDKLDISHKVGGLYYRIGRYFDIGYLPSEKEKHLLLEIYDTINSAIIRPFVFIFDGMVSGGTNCDIGTKYEVLAWKNSELKTVIYNKFEVIFEDISKEKNIEDMLKRRSCKIKGKSSQGKKIERIIRNYPKIYNEIFKVCEKEELFKILLNCSEKTKIQELGLKKTEIDFLVNLEILHIIKNNLTFNKHFETFWSSGDWLPAYFVSLLENKNKIDFEFCTYIEDENKVTHEIDLIVSNKRNTIVLIECKTRNKKEIGMNEIKKFYSAINSLEPISHKYFVGFPNIEINANIYSMSKGINSIGLDGNILVIKKILNKIISEI